STAVRRVICLAEKGLGEPRSRRSCSRRLRADVHVGRILADVQVARILMGLGRRRGRWHNRRKGKRAMANDKYRIEHDLLGDRQVPMDAYYGVHTLRAAENFPITGNPISI